MTATRRKVLGATAGLLVAAGAGVAILGSGPDQNSEAQRAATATSTRTAFPPPPGNGGGDDVAFSDFVGAETCGGCHARQYRAWSGSTHGQAGGVPGPAIVLPEFAGEPIRFQDAVVTPAITGDGEYIFTVAWRGGPPDTFRVVGVVGGGHMVGGGTQGYFVRHPDGTMRLFPVEFIRREAVWFCNTNPRTGEGWIPITTEVELADCGDWPPTRVLGDVVRRGNCQSCHGSQILTTFDTASNRYRTRYTSLRINCESCHGPGRRHVEIARAGRMDEVLDVGLPLLDTLSTDESLAVCFRCHALKSAFEPGYLPGDEFENHYALKFPILSSESPYFADGRVRTFAYQATHLYSDCYLNGGLTCVACHDPHSQEYRDVRRRPLESRFSNGQCTACHPSKAVRLSSHTHHPPDSEGSRCVACHMPYLQQPLLGSELRYARSDHTIPIPRPAFDDSLGIRSACAQCHEEAGTAALARQTRDWWGELKPHKRLVRGLRRVRQSDSVDRLTAARLLLRPRDPYPILQFAALGYFAREYLDPDMRRLDPLVSGRLKALARQSDIDVAALALAALHLARGTDPEVHAFLSERLRSFGDSEEAVRKRWAAALGFLGSRYRSGGDFQATIAAYRKALEIRPRDPRVLVNLGIAYRDAGQATRAVELFERALDLDPGQPITLVNLGMAYGQQQRTEAALTAYERAIELNPFEPLAHINLGNIFLRRRQPDRAVPHYRRALELSPGLPRARFYLALAYTVQNEYEMALDAAETALEFDPDNSELRRLARDLRQVLGTR